MYLQLDTKFNPFTYDEMVKPLLYYKQAYDQAEAAYSDLATQTEAWKYIANKENSPEAYEMYQRYSSELNNAIDDFSKGMTLQNRRALLGLKRRYASDIDPIRRAHEAMKEANDLRVKAGPDAIFEVGSYNSLDQFLHGKTANNKYQSRDALTKRTAAITEAAMAEALRDPEFKKAMGDQYWIITQHTGGSYDELTEAMKQGMLDNPIAQNRFSQIRQRMLKDSGIENYDAIGQQAIIDAVDLGLYAGLDKQARSFQGNQGYLNPLQLEQLRQSRSTSSGSSNGRGKGKSSDSSIDDSEKSDNTAYTANDVIYEINDSGKASVVQDMSSSDLHGYRTSYEALPAASKRVVNAHIGNSDSNQYEFYSWRTSNTGKLRVQIKRKQAYTKPGKSETFDMEGNINQLELDTYGNK